MNGLNDGEEIVTEGAFSVDASAQLEVKPSMMNPKGGQTSTMPGMDMTVTPKSNLNNTTASDSPSLNLKNNIFGVSGTCELCKERIEMAAKSVTGVSSAVWDLNTKKVTVKYVENQTTVETIEKTIANAGHDTEKFKATDEAYKQLPECCLYRK